MSKSKSKVNSGFSKKRVVKTSRKKKDSGSLLQTSSKPKVLKEVLPKLPVLSTDEVVKKRESAARYYVFTINNYREDSYDEEAEDTIEYFISKLTEGHESNILYVIIGREIGAKGTPHLQGYLELKKKGIFFGSAPTTTTTPGAMEPFFKTKKHRFF